VVLAALASISAMLVCVALGYSSIVIVCMALGCVRILISAVASTLGDVLQSMERFESYSVTTALSGVVVTVASVIAVLAGSGAIGLTVAYLSAPMVLCVLWWREVGRDIKIGVRWKWERAKALLHASRLLGLNSLVAAGRDRAEQLIIPAVLGLKNLGIFSAGNIVADRLGYVPDAVGTAFYPRVSRAAAGATSAFAIEPVLGMLTLGLTACVPMAIAGAYIAGPIARILLPDDSQLVGTVIQLTVLSLPLLALSTSMAFCLQASAHHDSAARTGIGASVISLALSAVCVATAGIVGACWSLVARPGILAAALLPAFHQAFPGALRALPVMRILVASAGLAVICRGNGERSLPAAVAYSAAGIGVYTAALLAMRVFSVSDIVQVLSRTADRS